MPGPGLLLLEGDDDSHELDLLLFTFGLGRLWTGKSARAYAVALTRGVDARGGTSPLYGQFLF